MAGVNLDGLPSFEVAGCKVYNGTWVNTESLEAYLRWLLNGAEVRSRAVLFVQGKTGLSRVGGWVGKLNRLSLDLGQEFANIAGVLTREQTLLLGSGFLEALQPTWEPENPAVAPNGDSAFRVTGSLKERARGRSVTGEVPILERIRLSPSQEPWHKVKAGMRFQISVWDSSLKRDVPVMLQVPSSYLLGPAPEVTLDLHRADSKTEKRQALRLKYEAQLEGLALEIQHASNSIREQLERLKNKKARRDAIKARLEKL